MQDLTFAQSMDTSRVHIGIQVCILLQRQANSYCVYQKCHVLGLLHLSERPFYHVSGMGEFPAFHIQPKAAMG